MTSPIVGPARRRRSAPPTWDQIRRLYTLASAIGLDRAGVHAEIHDRYGVESTRDLTPRWYEQYTRELERRGRRRRQAAEHSLADQAAHHPRVMDRDGCRRILIQEWPALATIHADLAEQLVEVMDCIRLYRGSGLISPRVLAVQVQRWRKFSLAILCQAADIFLGGYTTRGERYFYGICRRLQHDEKNAGRDAQRKQEAEKRRAEEAAQHRTEQEAQRRADAPARRPAQTDPAAYEASLRQLAESNPELYQRLMESRARRSGNLALDIAAATVQPMPPLSASEINDIAAAERRAKSSGEAEP